MRLFLHVVFWLGLASLIPPLVNAFALHPELARQWPPPPIAPAELLAGFGLLGSIVAAAALEILARLDALIAAQPQRPD